MQWAPPPRREGNAKTELLVEQNPKKAQVHRPLLLSSRDNATSSAAHTEPEADYRWQHGPDARGWASSGVVAPVASDQGQHGPESMVPLLLERAPEAAAARGEDQGRQVPSMQDIDHQASTNATSMVAAQPRCKSKRRCKHPGCMKWIHIAGIKCGQKASAASTAAPGDVLTLVVRHLPTKEESASNTAAPSGVLTLAVRNFPKKESASNTAVEINARTQIANDAPTRTAPGWRSTETASATSMAVSTNAYIQGALDRGKWTANVECMETGSNARIQAA
ncbi:hypothetical protein ON010_g18911 [Phytophthora cinnamomi]|nr:hypothetical protein ON010_g18911 [Phytophthora cinnamomi]